MFEIDPQLKQDCHWLAELNHCHILLMDNESVPWFIIVPQTEKTELYQLENQTKSSVYHVIDCLSAFVHQAFEVSKLNVAALGNMVKQLHIHVIGRNRQDPAWPKPVWGQLPEVAYSPNEIANIKAKLNKFLNESIENN